MRKYYFNKIENYIHGQTNVAHKLQVGSFPANLTHYEVVIFETLSPKLVNDSAVLIY